VVVVVVVRIVGQHMVRAQELHIVHMVMDRAEHKEVVVVAVEVGEGMVEHMVVEVVVEEEGVGMVEHMVVVEVVVVVVHMVVHMVLPLALVVHMVLLGHILKCQKNWRFKRI